MDFLFGAETPLAVKFFIAFVIVLGLIGGTAYLVRRFGSERLAAAGRGRQPRLAVVDAAAVDGRRRLILIRRDNVEHLLLIGGPTDVVVEPNILRAAAAPRETTPQRQPAGTDTLARAVPLGEGSMWPLQPQAEPAPPPAPAPIPRPQRTPVVAEPVQWHAEPEPPAPAPPPQQRQTRQVDPLAGLAAELARAVPQSAPAAVVRRPARTPLHGEPRIPAREIAAEPSYQGTPDPVHEPAQSALQAQTTEAPFASPADQNLAEMAQRLEAALRRPAKRPDEMRIADLAPKVPLTALDPQPVPPPMEPAHGDGSPLRAAEAPRVEAPSVEAPRAEAPLAEPKPAQQKSLYDSLEQEMASLLGRPNKT
jgi:flagellar protein FliO/FliZ